MVDQGFFVTLHAVRSQLHAMPWERYLVRLIHHVTGRAFPQRLWTAAQLWQPRILRFLRWRNREGCDVYIQPFAGNQNAGYILVDLDAAPPTMLEAMRRNGHAPCVVLQSSPTHWQAWVRVSPRPVEPAVATAIGRHLAHLYGGDPASTDWRHLGRLAGFTNQKPQRRLANGYAPWVRLQHAQPGYAQRAAALLEDARQQVHSMASAVPGPLLAGTSRTPTPAAAARIYRAWLDRLRIGQRFPQPDWSIVDQWVAQELLRGGVPPATTAAILQGGSPGFPRRHADPRDYLRRTLACAYRQLARRVFPPPGGPCVDPPHGWLPEGGGGTGTS